DEDEDDDELLLEEDDDEDDDELELSLPPPIDVHFLILFDHSSWIVKPATVSCVPLQMSPISPFVSSYQASGGPSVVARPTAPSVVASIISCDETSVRLSCVLALSPQPPAHAPPRSGMTP